MRAYVIVDVFTDTPLEGNPVAVFLDGARAQRRDDAARRRELNLSETVFLLPSDEPDGGRPRPHLHARASFRSPAIRCSGPRSCSASASPSEVVRSPDRGPA